MIQSTVFITMTRIQFRLRPRRSKLFMRLASFFICERGLLILLKHFFFIFAINFVIKKQTNKKQY